MTYAAFLAMFLVLPIILLALLLAWDRHERRRLPEDLRGWPPLAVVLALAAIAVAYTALWDDHLIALRVWDYAPHLISGWRLDRMPVEELGFIALQPLLVGLWGLWLAPRLPARPRRPTRMPLGGSMALAGAIWVAGLALLLARWQPGTYLGWELAWALPPIMLQLAVAGAALWARRRLLAYIVVVPWLYLCATDALAIHLGIWAINPQASLGVLLAGWLPVEEALFFLLSTALVGGGLVAGLALTARVHGRAAAAR